MRDHLLIKRPMLFRLFGINNSKNMYEMILNRNEEVAFDKSNREIIKLEKKEFFS